jgi:hypothetical protein
MESCNSNWSTEVGCEVVDWIHLAQDRVQQLATVKTIMNLRVS